MRGACARRGALLALLAASLALLPGCYITDTLEGRPLPDTSALQVGLTTKAQALSLLGPPLSVRRQFDGDLLSWRRTASHSETLRLVPLLPLYEHTEGHADADILTLLFDRQGVLAGAGTQCDISLPDRS
jgi:hypothetical protein